MKKFNAIISILVTFSVLFSVVPVSASDNAVLYIGEYFDNYATNSTSLNPKINKGADGRIVLRNEKTSDKAVYAKALTSPVAMSAAITSPSAKYVISADIMVDGAKASGNVMKLVGTNTVPLIIYEANGTVRLGDKTRIGGYKLGEWINYTFVINRTKQKYDLYINGKCVVEDWYFKGTVSNEKSVDFELKKPSDADFAELYADNLYVYSGNKILKASSPVFANREKNDEEYPFTPSTDTIEIGDTVFLQTSGSKGFVPTLSPKTGISEFAPMNEGEPERLHIARPAGPTSDVYADIFMSGMEEVVHYVYQKDIYPEYISSGATMNLAFIMGVDGKNYTTLQLTSGGNVRLGTTNIMKIPLKQWSEVSFVVKTDTETVDVYLNGVLKVADFSLAVAPPSRIRIGFVNGNSAIDVYVDNIRVYEGSEIRDLGSPDDVPALVSVAEKQSEVTKITGDSVVFMTQKENLFFNDEKKTYEEHGIDRMYKDDILYLNADAFSKLFGSEITYNSANGEITSGSFKMKTDSADYTNGETSGTLSACPTVSDGKLYLPLAAVAKDILGKYVYEDARGWILVGDNDLSLSNSPSLMDFAEKSDIIDRFMQFDRPDAEELYDALVAKSYKQHPRLFITPDEVKVLKENIKNNELLTKWSRNAIGGADALLNRDPVAYEIPDGLRLFLSCQEVRQRLFQYAVAYLITDDKKYADGAWKEIENACNWKDWNVTRHYLDSGKIGPGMAVAYDVFYNVFTDEQKAFMRTKITELYLNFTRDAYVGRNSRKEILRNRSNWASVCNGSVLMWCLATMDEEEEGSDYTELTKFLGATAIQGLEYNVSRLYPEGLWDEGVSYYNYVLEYLSWSLLSLRNSCGEDYGILSYPGYQNMPTYSVYLQTPGHGAFNFNDGSSDSEIYTLKPEIFLISKLTDNKELNDMWYNYRFNMMGAGYDRLDLLFYTPGDVSTSNIDFPLDRVIDGVDISVMKGGWDVSSAYAATLGGPALVSEHSHVGSFIYEALGERWAVDLGCDDYNIEGGYYREDGLTIYRRRAEGHNTIVINPDASTGQTLGAMATIDAYESKPKGVYTVYDLSDIYSQNATSAKRGFMLGDDRNTLLIQDEITFKKPNSDIYWFMHTKSDIEVSEDKKSAILTKNGKKIRIEFESNLSEWEIQAREAKPLETTPPRAGQNENKGITKVTLVGKGSGDCYITAKIIPIEERRTYPGVSYVPLSQWSIPDGEIDELMNIEEIKINGYPFPGFDVLKKEYEYSTPSTEAIPVISATANKGTVTVTQAPAFGEYAVITLTDGTETLTYKIKIELGLIDSLKQTDNSLKPIDDGTTDEKLTSNTMELGIPQGMSRLPIVGFYSSDAQTGNPAEHVFDRDLSSRWASEVEGAHIVVDLGKPTKLGGSTFIFYDGDKRQYKFEVHVSNDNKNYTKVFAGESTGKATEYESVCFDAEARYVKFVGFGHKTGAWNNIIEFSPIAAQ